MQGWGCVRDTCMCCGSILGSSAFALITHAAQKPGNPHAAYLWQVAHLQPPARISPCRAKVDACTLHNLILWCAHACW